MTGDEAIRLCLHEGLHRGEMRQVSPRGSAMVYKRYLKQLLKLPQIRPAGVLSR